MSALRLVQDTLLASARSWPEKEALVADGLRISYRVLLERALAFAQKFRACSLATGDRVTLFLPNGAELAAALYGVWLAGGVAMVVNPQTRAEKLAFLLEDSGARLMVTHPLLEATARRARLVMAGEAPELLMGEELSTGTDVDSLRGAPGALSASLASGRSPSFMKELLETGLVATDLALIIYTSGSSGQPKGVMLTHQNITFTLESLIEYLRLDPSDRILNVLPLAFDYGLYQLLMAVRLGATLVLEQGFGYPALIEQRLLEESITVFPGVPTLFATLLARAGTEPKAFPSVRRVTNTAAALPAAATPGLQALFPQALLFRMYGLTECKRVCYLEPEELEGRPDSVGKAIPGTQVFLVDEEGKRVGPGGTGILHVRGPHVMAGYWNRPDLTAEMLLEGQYPGDRVLRTGDLFHMDAEGFLYFLGRSDDIIKSRGEKVSPVEVERVLYSVPGVRDAAVLGVPDPLLGEAIHAYLSFSSGAEASERALRRFCQEHLESFMVPQVFHILEDLPKGTNGKILKKDLINHE